MYANKIQQVLTRIAKLLPDVLPRNRNAIDGYFASIWWVYAILVAFSKHTYITPNDEAIRDRFQEYVDIEDARIRANLQKIRYHIDASDTLTLVIGSGRLERVSSSTCHARYLSHRLFSSRCSPSYSFCSRTIYVRSGPPKSWCWTLPKSSTLLFHCPEYSTQ